MTISNRVSLILVGGFFVLAIMTGMPLAEIGMHLAAAAIVLTITFVFFARGWIGGGDAKLAAATALWLGFDQLLNYVICASLLGGLLTLAIMRFRLMPLPSWLANQEWAKRLHRMDTGIPYGIALAIAALVVYPDTPWMKSLGL
jgi:prepilin peptidase CpaA